MTETCHLCGLPLSLYPDALDMGDGTAIHGVCVRRPAGAIT